MAPYAQIGRSNGHVRLSTISVVGALLAAPCPKTTAFAFGKGAASSAPTTLVRSAVCVGAPIMTHRALQSPDVGAPRSTGLPRDRRRPRRRAPRPLAARPRSRLDSLAGRTARCRGAPSAAATPRAAPRASRAAGDRAGAARPAARRGLLLAARGP